MRNLLPLFLDLAGRDVLLVGGGAVAAGKLRQLLAAGARVRVVSPLVGAELERVAGGSSPAPDIARRAFEPSDLGGMWLVVAAATPEVNRAVAEAATARRVFVNAVDDPDNATAFMSGVVRREDVTIAISTGGDAPGLTALLREALDALIPRDIKRWLETARAERVGWRRDGVPMAARKPLLLRALNELYDEERETPGEETPRLGGLEDSWL